MEEAAEHNRPGKARSVFKLRPVQTELAAQNGATELEGIYHAGLSE